MSSSHAEIIARGTVFMGDHGSASSSACFPSIAVLPSGRWVVGFRAAPAKSNTRMQRFALTWSDDAGHTWSEPSEPLPPPAPEGRRGTLRAGHVTPLDRERIALVTMWVDGSDPSLPFFNEQTEGLLDTRVFLSFSVDNAQTWSDPRPVDTSPYDVPVPITGPILCLPDGTLILHFETNKHYDDASVWHHASVFLFSTDHGMTWSEHVSVAADPEARIFYWDQRPNVMRDGTVLDLFWTFDRQEAVYLPIHGRESLDGGRTWSGLWDTGVPGQPAQAVMLSDGRIVMPYVDREGLPVIKLRVSQDRGRTWPVRTEVVLSECAPSAQQRSKDDMQDAWSEMAAFSLGLPATALLPCGDVVVVYYSGSETDHTGIRWVRCRGF